jgi:sigma-B regulation protein RsbU (phosphoserine phosphatase)
MLVRQRVCNRLDSLTPPVGVLRDLPNLQNSVQLASGDWLLISSDGIPEAANQDGGDFGDDRLLGALRRLTDKTAEEVCEGIVAEVRSHIREQRQPDDITLIAMKVL